VDRQRRDPVSAVAAGGKRQEYRIPLAGLLRSPGGNYDLAGELRSLDAAALEAGVTDADVLAALDDDEQPAS
jgi:hypothetical protein